jgi:hypothetical protein
LADEPRAVGGGVEELEAGGAGFVAGFGGVVVVAAVAVAAPPAPPPRFGGVPPAPALPVPVLSGCGAVSPMTGAPMPMRDPADCWSFHWLKEVYDPWRFHQSQKAPSE